MSADEDTGLERDRCTIQEGLSRGMHSECGAQEIERETEERERERESERGKREKRKERKQRTHFLSSLIVFRAAVWFVGVSKRDRRRKEEIRMRVRK